MQEEDQNQRYANQTELSFAREQLTMWRINQMRYLRMQNQMQNPACKNYVRSASNSLRRKRLSA